jgi:hypothetical protein
MELTAMFGIDNRTHIAIAATPPASAAHSPPDTHSDPSFHIPCTLYFCIPDTNFKHKMIF